MNGKLAVRLTSEANDDNGTVDGHAVTKRTSGATRSQGVPRVDRGRQHQVGENVTDRARAFKSSWSGIKTSVEGKVVFEKLDRKVRTSRDLSRGFSLPSTGGAGVIRKVKSQYIF